MSWMVGRYACLNKMSRPHFLVFNQISLLSCERGKKCTKKITIDELSENIELSNEKVAIAINELIDGGHIVKKEDDRLGSAKYSLLPAFPEFVRMHLNGNYLNEEIRKENWKWLKSLIK